jgi:hypothetical protein
LKDKKFKEMNQLFTIAVRMILFSALIFSCSRNSQLPEEQFNNIISGFITPADDNTVWCYWYWINDDISIEGITKDLEAMKKAGIGAAFIGNINPAGVDGRVPLFSEEWWKCMVHAVTEGDRIGVDIGIFNCPGWSQSGGPWVKSDMAMRYLAYSETKLKGPEKVNILTDTPDKEFMDTHTLAFKTSKAEKNDLRSLIKKAETSPDVKGINNLFDNNSSTSATFLKQQGMEVKFEFKLEKPITARQITIAPGSPVKCNCELIAEMGGNEKSISQFIFDRSNLSVNVGPVSMGELAVAIPETKADKFILTCNNFTGSMHEVKFSEINISESPVLEKYIEKQLGKMHPTPTPEWETYVWKTQEEISNNDLIIKEVLDISDKLDKDGLLLWDVPEGEWTVMRIGMLPTGTKNSPSAPQGQGYEIDKMNSELVKIHFDNFVGELLKRIPEESKDAFKYVIADSYEMGSQNWTDKYEDKFKLKYGYDPVKYLPVLSGRIVDSAEESERFLWDLRRTVADDIAYEYVGGLRKASENHNLKTWLENYGHWGFPSEFMMYGGQSSLISGEFWNEGSLGNIECKASSSTAHVYGKPITSAEAFTASGNAYMRHPAVLKKRGDWSFTEGINHFVLHLYIQQPDENRVPGMNAWFSTEFNRHNTWFDQADNYFDYLRRCQHMLQQGRYVADVCYFIGENAPIMTGVRDPELPKGYSYDYINAEVILNRLSVEDGRFVLPDGMSYNVMVLPPLTTMRPELLAKIEQLVLAGGKILGPKPVKSPSLQNYPECDNQVKELAAKLWKGEYKNGKLVNNYGEGIVMEGFDMDEVFNLLQIEKDLEPGTAPVLWTHRTLPGMEIYFITNQSDDEISFTPSFRVKGLKPQLWDAVTGELRYLKDYSEVNGRTEVPLKMEAQRSWFVVFTNSDNDKIRPSYENNFPIMQTLSTIEGPFEVDFVNKEIGPSEALTFAGLQDWSESDNEKIKYYSGSAIYRTTFTIKELPENKELFINPGNVAVMADVKINGTEAGGVWIAPFRLNVSNILKEGNNELEIKVVNLWRNQLIKDNMLPENERYTWTVINDIKENEKPHTSGLLGPVTIEYIN